MQEENITIKDLQEKKSGGWLKEIISFILIVVFVVLPIRLFVAKPFLVSGQSMFPTFLTGDYLIIDQLTYRFQNPKRGDVIVFKFPNDTSKYFIKRLIGLPGETVTLNGETVTINNQTGEHVLTENYVTNQKAGHETITLSSDEYFVMGDNRLESFDSRSWGPLDGDYIVGRAYVRLLPANSIGILPGSANY